MRVLVFGRTGQLGRALARVPRAGAAHGSHFLFIDRENADLTKPGKAGAVVRHQAPDLVINAAAYTAVDRAQSEPAAARRVNAEAAGEIATAAAEIGAAVVHISTDYVFDGKKAFEYIESDPPHPLNVYGHTKLSGERLVRQANPRSLVLRTSWVYAPWGQNFVLTMLKLAGKQAALRIVADQKGKPTSALDLADTLVALAPELVAAGKHAPIWGTYHYTGAGSCSWAEFAEVIFRKAQLRLGRQSPLVEPIRTVDYPTLAPRPANSALNCARFETTFHIRCVPWRVALDRVLEEIAREEAI